jgi:hypothetical protein
MVSGLRDRPAEIHVAHIGLEGNHACLYLVHGHSDLWHGNFPDRVERRQSRHQSVLEAEREGHRLRDHRIISVGCEDGRNFSCRFVEVADVVSVVSRQYFVVEPMGGL